MGVARPFLGYEDWFEAERPRGSRIDAERTQPRTNRLAGESPLVGPSASDESEVRDDEWDTEVEDDLDCGADGRMTFDEDVALVDQGEDAADDERDRTRAPEIGSFQAGRELVDDPSVWPVAGVTGAHNGRERRCAHGPVPLVRTMA